MQRLLDTRFPEGWEERVRIAPPRPGGSETGVSGK